jgi:hypothetical protein
MTEAVFQHVRASGKKFERSSIVLDTMWFETFSFGIATCPCAKTVPESNAFNRFELSLSEKQIPRFVGNASS